MKAFITGIAGQDGAYLSKFLLDKNYDVHGLAKPGASRENLNYLNIADSVSIHYGDIRDHETLGELVHQTIRPDEIYNLAAHSFVGDSWEDVRQVNMINYLAVISLLDIIKHSPLPIKFYQASTGEMFGSSDETGVQTEETPFHPRSPYAVSKLAAYEIVNNYRDSYALFCCNGICFNHESPLRAEHFVTRKISLGAAKIKLGQQHTIELGNLDSVRDWGFAGDYVEAMWLMLQQNKPDNYIISTGIHHSIRDVLDIAFRSIGVNDWSRYVSISDKFKRPLEFKKMVGSNAKAQRFLGWRPRIKFQELIEMMVEADMRRLQNQEP
ncbi:MAG: GDP-mannose 4,6-dehydratase [Candidatus Kaiserbacteria bacterium GW2011_GWA2_49_19]|uniref:GDP-mannose 4,6-dehydratase n=1 Tax=Candidatus Kaiserbacteria bacterium GW2011_GWA2_49_19 TaxID=1618669 RepID=A0A0G1VRK2_9BACT|nr:MAG: GDP-mannose 4,6-dehydratase [Candidatus Kaiserbacteria bacterium GW2011_GWA2_49_19]